MLHWAESHLNNPDRTYESSCWTYNQQPLSDGVFFYMYEHVCYLHDFVTNIRQQKLMKHFLSQLVYIQIRNKFSVFIEQILWGL